MFKHISINKHEFNVRRVDELNEVISEKEAELEKAKGFMQTLKVKLELQRLYKQLYNHGNEVLEYEYIQRSREIN